MVYDKILQFKERKIWAEAEKLTFEIIFHKVSMNKIAPKPRVKNVKNKCQTVGIKLAI